MNKTNATNPFSQIQWPCYARRVDTTKLLPSVYDGLVHLGLLWRWLLFSLRHVEKETSGPPPPLKNGKMGVLGSSRSSITSLNFFASLKFVLRLCRYSLGVSGENLVLKITLFGDIQRGG